MGCGLAWTARFPRLAQLPREAIAAYCIGSLHPARASRRTRSARAV